MSYVFRHIGKCEKFTLSKGRYKFELWGANGGSNQATTSYGGYSSGILLLSKEREFYACVGGKGSCSLESSECLGGFNGGGNGSTIGPSAELYGCGGGGATDVRKDPDSLESRIIVAGGSGGTVYYNGKTLLGGSGGGTKGGDGLGYPSLYLIPPLGGSDDKGGSGGQWMLETLERKCNGTDGTKGFGGNSCSIWTSSSSGGGGGWFGGGGAADAAGGGGGSGHIENTFLHRVMKNGDEITIHPEDGNGLLLISILPKECTQPSGHYFRFFFLYFLFVFK